MIPKSRLRNGGNHYEFWRESAVLQEEGGDHAGTACREDGGVQTDNFQMGSRSFPNKRILRNNLCLPACKLLYLTNEKKLSIDRNNVKYYNCL